MNGECCHFWLRRSTFDLSPDYQFAYSPSLFFFHRRSFSMKLLVVLLLIGIVSVDAQSAAFETKFKNLVTDYLGANTAKVGLLHKTHLFE